MKYACTGEHLTKSKQQQKMMDARGHIKDYRTFLLKLLLNLISTKNKYKLTRIFFIHTYHTNKGSCP